MRLPRPSAPRAGSSPRRLTFLLFGSIIPIVVGCGGMTGSEPAKTEVAREKEQKIESLVKQGKSLSEIRAIMKGEPVPSKKGGKKAARKH